MLTLHGLVLVGAAVAVGCGVAIIALTLLAALAQKVRRRSALCPGVCTDVMLERAAVLRAHLSAEGYWARIALVRAAHEAMCAERSGRRP